MYRFNKLVIFIFLLATFFSSCVSSRVDSNKRKDFTTQVKKVFITGRSSAASKEFMKLFSKNLLDGLKAKGVECVFYYYDPLGLETKEEILKMINDYNAEAVMNIEQTESTIQVGNMWSGNSQTEAIFLVNLFTPDMNSPVWKASINISASLDLTLGSKQSAKRLIEKMVDDKVIDKVKK